MSIKESGLLPLRMASQVKAHRIGFFFAANSCCASGVNNVLSGVYSYLEESGRLFELIGFVGGPVEMAQSSDKTANIITIKSLEHCSRSNNLGGTEMLGYSSFDNVNLSDVAKTCTGSNLTGLVIVAASDELPAAVQLSHMIWEQGKICAVIVPQSRNQHVMIGNGICETSLGFDSARRILAELAGNIAVDCISSKKYWHFINCGDTALVGEVGLLIRANMCVTEHDRNVRFEDWANRVADLIEHRSVSLGIRSGVVMISQCAFSRTNEMESLRKEISDIEVFPVPEHVARKKLSKESMSFLEKLPKEIKTNLLRKRDKSGQPLLTYWSPEEFLVDEVKAVLTKRKHEVTCRTHFLAHESRCPVPSGFDSVLGSSLGRTAGAFVIQGLHGYMTSIMALHLPVNSWTPVGVDLGADSMVTDSLIMQRGYCFPAAVAAAMESLREKWETQSRYRSFGPSQITSIGSNIAVDESFLPLSILAVKNGGSLVDTLDPVKSGIQSVRPLTGTEPIIRLPIRSTIDMSPIESQRRLYQPRIPAYLTEPFTCIDADVCARVCVDSKKLENVFPHSHAILPVDIVSSVMSHKSVGSVTVAPQGGEPAVPIADASYDSQKSVIEDDESPLHADSLSSLGDFENHEYSQTPYRLIETHISAPYYQRLLDATGGSRVISSPRGRSLPPNHSQLIHSNKNLVWRPSEVRTDSGNVRSISIESMSSLGGLQRHVTTGGAVSGPSKLSRVGIVFMCSQVPGCHNVVSGLFDYLRTSDADSELIGFLGGSTGLKKGWTQSLTSDMIDIYRNQGGQDLLGHFGESLATDCDFNDAVETIKTTGLNALVIVGNLEGQLTGALLTEKILQKNLSVKIITVPASAENEIPFIRQSIGCDTVTRVFANAVANLSTEAHSSRHRWYFVRLMSHHVSHLALEVALATHPNIVLVTEEVAARKQSLAALTEMIAECICRRSKAGKDYGVVLIPDGVVAAVPEIRRLLRELDKITAKQMPSIMNFGMRLELIQAQLSRFSSTIFMQLPRFVQADLISGMRHPETGKIDIANVAMERILQSLVLFELEKRRKNGHYDGRSDLLVHALAYQGRSSLPTNFDCDLAYTCGYTGGILLESGRTGLMTNVTYSHDDSTGEDVWTVGGLPLVGLVKVAPTAVSIEPTKLVMTGNACRALFDCMPLPEFREGRQPGPYQFSSSPSGNWQLCLGNLDSWTAFEGISNDCREILTLAGRGYVMDQSSIEKIISALENIVSMVSVGEQAPASSQQDEDWFLQEPDDILSTCTPQRSIVPNNVL